MTRPASWDIFCRVVDNHGDLGVCWRLACQLARHATAVRLYTDDASALAWMAPEGEPGVAVLPWEAAQAPGYAAADAVVEAFGCALEEAVLQSLAWRHASRRPAAWINLEYLSAEPWVERCHGLRSPVSTGPAAGLTKHFFYPGFTPATGGLLREPGLAAHRDAFDRAAWLRARGITWHGEPLVSLFCYEPAALPELLQQAAARGMHVLVTPGRAAAAVAAAGAPPGLRLTRLPALPQAGFDELLWSCDLNCVRGEDSLVRALWAGRPFAWNIYPQDDGAHRDKLLAFLDWMQAPATLRSFSLAWNRLTAGPLPALDAATLQDWGASATHARARAWKHADLCSQLMAFAAAHAHPLGGPDARS